MKLVDLPGLPGAVRFELESKHVGDRFTISVFCPDLSRVPMPPDQIPERLRVLYLTDSDSMFPAAWSAIGLSGMVALDLDKPFEPVIVVGVGYGMDDPMRWLRQRARDLTPPGTPLTEEAIQVMGPDVAQGHADRFLRFLEDELDPVIRREFPTTGDRAGLFGHSFGGLFASYALFSRSPSFDRYIIGSPGNVFPEPIVLDLEERCHAAGRRLDASAYITLGSLERAAAFKGFGYIAETYDTLVARLNDRAYEGFSFTAHEYPDQSHVSTANACLFDGLRLLYPAS